MYLIDFYFLFFLKDIFKNIYIFIKNDLIIIFKDTIFNIKNICNIFYIFLVLIYIINLLVKYFFYDFYKIIKPYKNIFINSIFLITIIFLSDINNIIVFLLDKIYIKIGNENFSIFSLTVSVFWMIITLSVNLYNSFIFEIIFSDIESIDLNYRILIFKFLTSFIFFIILISGFTIMKLDKFLLSILGGAFSLGLSLSLQKLFTNYISSFIILFDKSLKLGDAVNINGHQGVITQVSNRYVMLRNLDCSEILVPNEKFLTEVVQNQSLYFSKGNLRINVQISYNNNIELALELLVKSTDGMIRIMENPPSLSYITSFSINNIELELSFWIIDAVRGAALIRSEVNMNIIILFKENNIELSYNRKMIKLIT